MLRDFFHSAMPDPWPVSPKLAQAMLPFQRSSSFARRVRSTLALAASLVLIAVGLAFVSGKFSDRSPTRLPGGQPVGNPYPDQPHHGKIQLDKK
jgi:hypothetical protein